MADTLDEFLFPEDSSFVDWEPGTWFTINGKGYIIITIERDNQGWLRISANCQDPPDPNVPVVHSCIDATMWGLGYSINGYLFAACNMCGVLVQQVFDSQNKHYAHHLKVGDVRNS